jgi:1-acyl-sn-glycerol-3-phosphate acyltransferase
MTFVRSTLFAGWFYLSLALSGLICLPATIATGGRSMAAGRMWARLTLFGLRWIVGARVRFTGLEHAPKGAAVVAAKHQSNLETVLPFIMLPNPAFVLKAELLAAPVLGWYATAMGMIPIDREAHASALKKLLRASRPARDAGRQIVIFPEGTRQELGVAGEYKPGVAAIYRDLGVPCVPVALDTGRIWSAKGVKTRAGVATIEFLPPIPPGLSREDFMRELETRIEKRSNELLADTPRA